MTARTKATGALIKLADLGSLITAGSRLRLGALQQFQRPFYALAQRLHVVIVARSVAAAGHRIGEI